MFVSASEPAQIVRAVPPGNDGCRERYLSLVSGRSSGFWSGVQRLGLVAAAWPYSAAVRLRNLAYATGWLPSRRVAAPVVSVGNLTTGGTGKTPMVEYVAGFYRRQERRVAILSRGYGSTGGLNDEALVLYDNLPDVPHLQGPDRVALALTAIEELESEILILDDGFQHRRLARAVDLVLIDATVPWGYGHLLPRGLLREPPSGLRRAHLVILTRCDQVDAAALAGLRRRLQRLAPAVPVVETCHQAVELVNGAGETSALDQLRDRPVAAFCGLGNPSAFENSLRRLGARLVAFRTYPDHHGYTREDVDFLHTWADGLGVDGPIVVTTQKDLVKLRLTTLGRLPLWALRIRLRMLQGQDTLHHILLGVGSSGTTGEGETVNP